MKLPSPRSILGCDALQGAGVDALIIAATAKPAAQAISKVYDLGWIPERYLFFGAASIAGTLQPAGLEKRRRPPFCKFVATRSDPERSYEAKTLDMDVR